MYDALYAALRRLRDTSPDGFEGFAAAVLQDFAPELAIVFLAKAGFQRGVDASSAGQGKTWAGLEAKHYQPGKCPSARELAGGLTLAINGAPDGLDAWLLVTTGAVGALEATELKQAADRAAVAVPIIAWQQAGLPALAVLCAAVSDATIRELTRRLPNLAATAVRADLAAIEAHPTFSARQDDLRERLSAAEIGFDHARNAANAWVLQSIGSSTEARARLGQQALCPLDAGFSEWIDRPNLRSALDAWYAGWHSSGAAAVLHGREGAGKSWIGLRWWTELPIKPLTLLVTSNLDAGARDPLDLMADLLVRQIGMGSPAAWRRRLDRWLRRSPGRTPAILVIVDGINERPREDWGTRFAGLRTQSLVYHVAVLATCWTSYWESRVRPRLAEDLPVHPIPGPPFDDAELREALRRAGRDFDQVPPRLREFLRTPRVFRIAVPYLGELRSGELTIERLLLLDWQHRLRTEYGIAHTEQEFRRIVLGLARDIRARAPNFAIHRLRAHSSLAQESPDRDLDRDFGEIVEGDLFEPDPGGDSELRVKQEHTGLVLGMLLADQVRRAAAADPADLDARVEQSIESASGFGEASEVLRGAVANACHWTGYPDRALQALLRGWLRLPNRPEEHLEDFKAYLPDRMDAYLGITDEVWANFVRYIDGREWIASAIVAHLGRDDVFPSVRDYANQRLGYWHETWRPFLGRAQQAWLDRHGSEVRATLDRASPVERELLRQHLVVPSDEKYPWASGLALVIASQSRRAPFVPGFLAWALSRALIGLPVDAEEVAWCLRLNRDDPVETEQGLLEAAGRLAAAGDIGRDAAILLLQALGTEACVDRLSALKAVPKIHEFDQRAAPVLPPDAEAPDLAPYLARLSGIDPGTVWNRMDRTTADRDLDDIEPAIAAFAPHDAAAFVRRVLRTAPQRDRLALRQLSWNAPAHSLLIGPDEVAALENTRRRLLLDLAEDGSKGIRFAEGQLMLAVSPALTPEQRFERLIERPEGAQMYVSLEATFAP